jgi:hypothetical protein
MPRTFSTHRRLRPYPFSSRQKSTVPFGIQDGDATRITNATRAEMVARPVPTRLRLDRGIAGGGSSSYRRIGVLRVVAVAALLSAVLAGCGSVPEETEEASSSEVRTARFMSTTEVRIERPDGGDPIRTTIEGVVDFVSGDFRLADVEGGEDSLVLSVDGVTYSRWGALLPPGKTWVREPDEPSDEPLASHSEFGLDPRTVIDYATDAYGPLQEVGREPIDGVETTHLHAKVEGWAIGTSQEMHSFEIDNACADYAAPPELDGTDSDQGDDESGYRFETSREIDVWVDDEGFARRVVSTDSGPYHRAETLRFYDFGIPLTVIAPPVDQVIDADAAWAWMEEEASTACAD